MKPPLGFSSWLEVQPYLKKRASQIFSLIANYATQSYRSGGVSQTFAQTHTLTRSTPRYVWDASGQLTAIAVDQPCYEYDPATGAAKGLFLNPESVTGLFTYSCSLTPDNGWNTFYGGDYINAAGSTGLGMNLPTYDKIGLLQGHAGAYVQRVKSVALPAGAVTGCTIVRKESGKYLQLLSSSAISTFIVNFDLDTGQIVYDNLSSHPEVVDAGSISLGNGWWLLYATLQVSSSVTANISHCVIPEANTLRGANWTAASDTMVQIAYQQDIVGGMPSVVTTTSSAVTVAADVCDLAALPTDYGTIGCFVINYSDPQIGSAIREMLGDGANAFLQLSADNLTVSATDGTNTASTSVTATGKNKVAVAWDSTTLKICANGGTVVTATHNGNLGSFASPPRLAREVAAWYSLLQYLPSTNTGNVIATDAKMQELTA